VSKSAAPKIWTAGSLAKVSTAAQPGTRHSVRLSAARNEFESFQVHVHSGTVPVQMNVTVSNFVGPRGPIINSASNVRADVIAATRERQVPWDQSSLIGEVILAR
jgi:hypothetical protein